MLIKNVTDENFSELLAENNSVVVFFRTEWCPLCNNVEKILTELEENCNSFSLFIVDFDKNELLTDKYQIIGIPTVAIFKCGEITALFPGLRENYAELILGIF